MRGTCQLSPAEMVKSKAQSAPLDDWLGWVESLLPSQSPGHHLVLSFSHTRQSDYFQYPMSNTKSPALFANTILVSRDAGQAPTLQTIGAMGQVRKKRPHNKSRRGCVACKRRRVKVCRCGALPIPTTRPLIV